MNILSNFIAQGAQKPTESQELNNLASKNEKQGMGQKFTQLMRGFLGMNSMSAENGIEHTGSTAKGNGEQPLVKSADHKSNESEALAGLFIGSHFITLKSVQNEAAPAAKSSGNGKKTEKLLKKMEEGQKLTDPVKATTTDNIQNEADAAAKLSGDQKLSTNSSGKNETLTLNDVPLEGKNATKQSDDVPEYQSSGDGKKTEKPLKKTKEGQKLTDPVKATTTDNVQNTVKQKGESNNSQQNSASGDEKVSAQIQSSVKKESESVVASDIKFTKKVNPEGQKTQADEIKGEQKKNTTAPKTHNPKSNDAQKVADQKSGEQKKPALKQLLNQAEGKRNLAKGKKAQTPAAQKINADTKTHSSLKPELTHSAAGVSASEQEKVSFKPIKQNSSTFELDPSKIIGVESGGSGDIEMELQARSDGNTSAKDEGKMSLNLGSSALSHLSNSNGRRDFSTQLVRQLQQSASGKGESAKSWNHHRFLMDDGKTLNVSVRHAQGAMHLQLSAGDTQLNKIIRQHIDEIRQHLQEQMNVEINLELQHFGGQQAGQEQRNSQPKTQNAGNQLGLATGQAASNIDQTPVRTARYLGFNTNEWTA